MEVGVNLNNSESSGYIVFYSEFEPQKALDKYQKHPEHKLIKPIIFESRNERREVDYEV